MLKTTLILVSGLLAVGACATPPVRIVYDKPGVTEADRQRDEVACASAAIGGARPDVGLGLIRIDRDTYDACMKGKGYTPRTVSS